MLKKSLLEQMFNGYPAIEIANAILQFYWIEKGRLLAVVLIFQKFKPKIASELMFIWLQNNQDA